MWGASMLQVISSARRAGILAAAIAAVGALVLAPAASAAAMTFSYTGPPVAIPDGGDDPGSPTTVTIPVSGLPTSLADVDFQIDGTACSTDIASTTVGIDHTYVGDLDISLTSPGGTTVLLIKNSSFLGEGHNFCQVLLDDDSAAPSIESGTPVDAPYTGTWTPNSPLSALDG